MKKIFLLPILFILFQCSDQNNVELDTSDRQSLKVNAGFIPSPISVETFKDMSIKLKIGTHFTNVLKTRQIKARIQNDVLENINFDFSKAKQYNFNNEIKDKAIAFSSPSSDSKVTYDFIAYLDKGNNPYQFAVIRKSTNLGENHFKLEFFTPEHDFIDGVESNNGVLERLSNSSANGRSWGACVGGKFDDMTNGTTLGSAAGLACAAFGVQCAVGIGVGCLIAWAIL